MENEDVILRQMEETRTSLTEKVETLEQKLVSSVQETTAAVTDTVETVKETMQESVETVKHWFDVKGHVQDQPWTMLGGSMALGFLVGQLLPVQRAEPPPTPPPPAPPPAAPKRQHQHNGGSSRRQQQEPSSPSWLSQFEPEINKLKGLALGAVLGTLREMVVREAPPSLGSRLKEVIDDVTKKVGGEPLPSVDFANCPLTTGSTEEPALQSQGASTTVGKSQQEQLRPATEHRERFKMQ